MRGGHKGDGGQKIGRDPRRLPAESTIELVRLAREGDRSALERLFERYVPRLRRWASGRLPRWARDMLDTDDMIQDALLATFRKLEDFVPRGDGALDAYLRQALHHRIVDELRKAHGRPARELIRSGQAAREASPLEQTIGRQAAELYERALGKLAEGEREAVVARIELGLDYERIASTLGKPTRDAARMAVSRALVRLAREMGYEG